jgi:hypothetical protein
VTFTTIDIVKLSAILETPLRAFLLAGEASFPVTFETQQAELILKQSYFKLRLNDKIIEKNKYSSQLRTEVQVSNFSEFKIQNEETTLLLSAINNSERDLIVITLRFFCTYYLESQW